MFERKFPGLSVFSSSSGKDDEHDSSNSDSDSGSFHSSRDEGARDEQITFRLKSVAGIGFILLAMFAVMETLTGDFSLRAPPPVPYNDRPLETRSVEHARKKVGFLERYFCRGGQRRSYFCD